jgi:hypothetical protein
MATVKSLRPRAKPAERETEVGVKIALQPSQDAAVFYANFFEVAHGPHDVTLYGVRVPAKLGRAEVEAARASGELQLQPDFQIVIAPSLVPGLVKALQSQLEKWQKRFGDGARGDDA